MSNANIGYLFSRLMYLDNDMKECTSANGKVPSMILRTNPLQRQNDFLSELEGIPESCYFDLTVAYPGLYSGLGYAHGIGGSNDTKDFKTGFYFDYTSGLPVIPGSSVKGVLRSALTSYPDLVFTNSKQVANDLIAFLFGSKNKERDAAKGNAIFFDAFPINAPNGLMGDDYITPHKSRTAAPNPIHTLKVKSGVTYRFRFCLPNFDNHGFGIDKEELLKKFKELLINLGIGAKTNTGYGYMKDDPTGQDQNAPQSTEPAAANTQPVAAPNTTTTDRVLSIKADKMLIEKRQVKISSFPQQLSISDTDQKTVLNAIRTARGGSKVMIKIKPIGIGYEFIEIIH